MFTFPLASGTKRAGIHFCTRLRVVPFRDQRSSRLSDHVLGAAQWPPQSKKLHFAGMLSATRRGIATVKFVTFY